MSFAEVSLIEVYSWPTPNGHKVHIMLEECDLPYQVKPVDIGAGEQFEPAFLAISPNNKVPAIVDPQGPDGAPLALFESGAILLYLAAKTGKFLPKDPREHYQVMQWLMFQMGGLGPMLGQAHHFRIYAPEKIDYAINRYTNEAKRLYSVMDKRLQASPFIGGNEYSIADMAIYPWLRSWKKQGIDWDDYPALQGWFERIGQRPAVQRGVEVLASLRRPLQDDRAKSALFGEEQYRQRHRITQGASGQENINWPQVLTSGGLGGVLGGAGTGLAHSALFNQGVEIVGNAMQRLGEIVGMGATRAGGQSINLLDESLTSFRGGESVNLGGKLLFKVPPAETFLRQEALDWYIKEYNLMVKQIDTKLPIAKQLELLDKAGQAVRKAAEAVLIDRDAVAEFAERVFKPGLKAVMDRLRAQSGLSGEALQKKAVDELRLPAIGCFVAGTLVHTKEGLKPIEQIKVGDWVLSRPENPEQGTETSYKRVTKTFRFEDKEVVRFWWAKSGVTDLSNPGDSVYVTPNHPVWLNPHGWVAMGRLYLPGKGCPGTIHRGDDEWLNTELVLADGSSGAMLDVFDLYRTDRPEIAFKEEDDGWVGRLYDFSSSPPAILEDLPYDYENWGDPVNQTRERYTTTVYNLEVEDWHTYFVGRTGLWVHNTNCLEANLAVAPGNGDVNELIKGALQFGP